LICERTRQLTTGNEELPPEIADRQWVEEVSQESQAELAPLPACYRWENWLRQSPPSQPPLNAMVTAGNFCTPPTRYSSAQPQGGAGGECRNREGTRASAVISRIRALWEKSHASNRIEWNFNEVIQESAYLVRNQATGNGVTMRLDLSTDLPLVRGDRVQLQQVLTNLIINGVDAMRSLDDGPRKLGIKSARDDRAVVVQVRDSGTGFDPEQPDRTSEPFFTTKPGGIGLGLSISRSIIESHGGRLWAESGSKGALFRFTLPTQD
jgi:C4-dicarboxylate-specific signal transduction histidine kinase